jgi:hypothetical protein
LQNETDGDISGAYKGRETKFLTTNHMLQQFGKGVKPPQKGQVPTSAYLPLYYHNYSIIVFQLF